MQMDTRALAAPLPGYRGTPYLSSPNRPQLYLVQSTGVRRRSLSASASDSIHVPAGAASQALSLQARPMDRLEE
jgi:hypothetical protein